MSDAPKCEPPEELRGVDGWHWVQLPFVAVPTPIAWMCNPDNQEREWRMPHASAFVSGESKTARTWSYLSPAFTPTEASALRIEKEAAVAEVARMRPLLEECANDLAMEIEAKYIGADKYPSEAKRRDRDMEIVNLARAALNSESAP